MYEDIDSQLHDTFQPRTDIRDPGNQIFDQMTLLMLLDRGIDTRLFGQIAVWSVYAFEASSFE